MLHLPCHGYMCQAYPASKTHRRLRGQPNVCRVLVCANYGFLYYSCLTCRRRKTRCAGEHPECSTCKKNGHTCLGYSDAPERKRESVGGGPDEAIVDSDELDYVDDEVNSSQRQWRTQRNGIKRQDTEDRVASAHHPSDLQRPGNLYTSVRPKSETVEEQPSPVPPGAAGLARRPTNPRHSSFSTEDGRSTASIRSPIQHHNPTENCSIRVPYFRYFGPTAIVPGFKQMVVKVHDRRRSSMSATSPSSGVSFPSIMTSVHSEHDEHLDDIPVYDPHDSGPVHQLILDLIDTFFVHLGCNYPFLRRDKFPRMVKEKRIEPILVDAVCALAARFSDNPSLNRLASARQSKADNGHFFAQRAKSAIVDTFPCPSVPAVQACLLLAYEGFGADQDSALWMYLGCAIRMAIDLGLHKKDGVKFQGEKDAWYSRSYTRKPSDQDSDQPKNGDEGGTLSREEQKELEQERIDTLWTVFILDRVISSGTGRPVTFRDDELELGKPKISSYAKSGWPDPFPSLVEIISLYGVVSDVLNKVIKPKDLTEERMGKLVELERELTRLHQKQHAKLRFDAANFQQHVKLGQGTTFILLHLWFHAMIIVLHQPTLLAPLINIDQASELAPHSRELSMSSAKTIADILAFANLIDAKSFTGNPFTSQPIYIAACAFLVESEKTNASQPPSRSPTPTAEPGGFAVPRAPGTKNGSRSMSKPLKRHFLLASAANQNYQACYKALQYMHTYWGGIRYILTALDQKSEGIWDCETYTREEYESTKLPRRSGSIQRYITKVEQHPSPTPGPPLAWSLTGTTNSPNSSLTLLFQNPSVNNPAGPIPAAASGQTPVPASAPTPPGNMIYDPIRQSLPESPQMYPPAYPQPNTSALRHSMSQPRPRRTSCASNQGKSLLRFDGMPPDDACKTPTTPEPKFQIIPGAGPIPNSFTPSSQHSSGYEASNYPIGASPTSTLADISSTQSLNGGGGNASNTPVGTYGADVGPSNFVQSGLTSSGYSYMGLTGQGMQLVTYDNETDIGQHLTSFEAGEMMCWFGDFWPNEVTGPYDPAGSSLGQ